MRPLRLVAGAAAAVLALASAGPALAALTRTVTLLDGDPTASPPGTEDLLFTQRAPGNATTEFGSAAAFGDLNGDGFDDAVVGHRTQNKVFIYLGRPAVRSAGYATDPNAADIVISAPPGTADAIQQFGFSLAAADLDQDGTDDLLVGAPFSDPQGRADQGLAFALLGLAQVPAGQSFAITAPPAGVTVVRLTRGAASKAGDLLGFSVGAVRGPSPADVRLVVTARGADGTTPTLRVDAGAAHVAPGAALPAGGGVTGFDLAAGSEVSLYGEDPGDALGEWVAACDVDGGGTEDLLVGAIFSDGPANEGVNRGEFVLLLGENVAGGWLSGAIRAPDADLRVHGAGNGDDLGYSVACGDLDGDGLGEMAAGAIFADAAADARPSAGEVHVMRGRTSRLAGGRRELVDPATGQSQGPIDLAAMPADVTLLGATTGDQLGFSLEFGDLDGDGGQDLIAAARLYDRQATRVNTGAAYVLLGRPGFLPAPGASRVVDLRAGTVRDVLPGYVPGTPLDHLPDQVDGIVVGASAEDNAGFALAAGNLDGLGGAEVLLSAIGDPARAPGFPGEAYVLSFQDADGDQSSDLIDLDNDNDGLLDDAEDSDGDGVLDPEETDPFDPDTDGDGVQDGTERGAACRGDGGVIEVDCDDPSAPYTSTDPLLALHFLPDADPATVTDPRDRDSDDDGLSDGSEDAGRDGAAGPGESDASRHDTDGDLIFDGTEAGRVSPLPDTDVAAGHFVPDADAGASTTDPTDPDSDLDGIPDGIEDADRNGAVLGDADLDHEVGTGEIWRETDPVDTDTDRDGVHDGLEDRDRDGVLEPGETDPLDQDSDDDGLPDGWIDGSNGEPLNGVRNALEGEDLDGDGALDALGESDPVTHDTDGDGLTDGVESGLITPGVPGRDGVPDTGPGQGGTDVTSANLRMDADRKASRTDPTSPDSDLDLIPDNIEDTNLDGAVAGDLDLDNEVDPLEVWTETDGNDPDTDADGLDDGLEDRDRDGIRGEPGETSPLDQDSDDDGLADGWIDGSNGQPADGFFQAAEGEDRDGDGIWGPSDVAAGEGESHPLLADSDLDGLPDGVEAGLPPSGGVPGRNGAPDAGPGEDGTDLTATAFRTDADAGATITEPWDADTDEDGLPDGFIDGFNPNAAGPGGVEDGTASEHEGEDLDVDGMLDAGETNPLFADTDGDGIEDGLERGVTAPGVLGPDGIMDSASPVKDGTAGGLATFFDTDDATLTDPLDADTDDDGLSDGFEDASNDGAAGVTETRPDNHDTDADMLPDGLERGRTSELPDTDLGAGHFIPDADPATTTNPLQADSDAGGTPDGEEDADLNGRVDAGERNPNLRGDDDRSGVVRLTGDAGDPIAALVPGDVLRVTLDDEVDADVDPDVAETLPVICSSDAGDQETLVLAATAPAGGVFTATLPTLASAAQADDGVLQVASGGSLACTYTDPQDPLDVRTASLPVSASVGLRSEAWVLTMDAGGGMSWTPAPGAAPPAADVRFNLYRGEPAVLKATGVYTQQAAACGLTAAGHADPFLPAAGEIAFYLVAGVSGGVEGSLGMDSAGRPRPSTEPCAP